MTAKNAVAIRFALAVIAICYSLTINAQLNANFTATPLSGCSPLIVSFMDQSTGNPTQWQWDLGNATTSTSQNPATTYFNPGTYTVKLVIKNAAGNADSITKTQYITVNAKPTVTFTASPLTGCYPLPVQFSSQSVPGSGTITSWQWDLGDGTFSTLENPAHTYTAAGNYNISLKVTNSFGCFTSITKPQYIQVGSGVHADFTNDQPANCDLPSTIQFQNASTGSGVLTYQWNFGDGGTSTLANPAHTYLAAGNYTVQLIVTNSTGCTDTITKTSAVSIGIVHAAFTNSTPVCENTAVTFTNTSAPAPTSVLWTFGDGGTSTSISPAHTYTTTGVYTVKMVASFGACKDSVTHTVIVAAKPVAAFTGGPVLTSCGAPFTVNFTDQSTNAASYSWDFGDGGVSTQPNPSYTYTSTGSFTVTLTVTNAAGCKDVLTKTNYVVIQPPVATINGLPVKDCAPLTHTFSASVTAIDPVVSYLWDFGDGTTSTQGSPTHVFNAGVYDITLIIKTAGGCSDTVKVIKGITASVKPKANFSAAPRDVCAYIPVNFTDLSTISTGENITQWLWNFGDGGTSASQNPVHMYEDTGYFSVQLIVWNEGCADTIKFTDYIHIKPPIAKFRVNYNCTDHFTRTFTDESIGADEWNWNFGDGITSTTQSPGHTYALPGTYTVTLLVRNHTTGCEYTKTATVQVMLEKAAFTASQTVICRNTPVNFSATGVTDANVASYSWTFGDGGTATAKTPAHTYTNSGTYTVRLIVTDILGCKDTLIKPLYIQVDGPVAAFAPVATGSCTMSTSVFTDNSTTDGMHPIASWVWDFGDGNTVTFTAPPFTHNYSTPGIYTVTLTVTDSKGCTDSYTKTAAMTISQPVAAFTLSDAVSCPGKPVTFTNASTGPGLSYTWNFGDATTSTATNPAHTYTADGNYTVQLSILDQYGCTDITTKQVKIASPKANFKMSDSVSTCPPLIVDFTNTSINTTSTVTWDFGDGTSTQSDNPSHFYSYPGTYNVKLHVTSPGGCESDIVKQVVISGPQGNFTYTPLSGCSPLTVKLTATTLNRLSFVWDYNDGNILATNDSVVTYVYKTPGNYLPKMILIDAGGCQVPIQGIDTVKVSGVVAKFGFTSPTLCDNGSVAFTDSSYSTNAIATYTWFFGDGGTAAIQNPTHHYSAPGLYYPSLAVTSITGCTDTLKLATPVKVVSSPQADIVQSPNGCAPVTITLNGSIVVADTSAVSWNWDLGNGVTSILQNPPAQVYSIAAAYNIKLIVTNNSGCKDTVTKTVEAYIVPTVSAGIDTMVCRGSGVTLHGAGADTYTWSPAGSLSCSNCPAPVASPADLTSYEVIGTTVHGCSNKDTVQVKVTQPFVMQQSKGDTLCKGSSLKLYATGASTYAWSPSTGLNSTTSPTPIATPATTTTYRVIGTDAKGCFRDTAYIPVKVYALPTVDAGADKTINVGQSVTLTPKISADVTSAIWSPTLNVTSSNFPAITVQPNETTAYLLEVKNEGGCKARSNVTVFVLCNGSNIFVPNTFSPNGDGANDVFYPRGTGLFSVKTLRIFNRWGEVVFEKGAFKANDASAGWDGTYKGAKLPPDVFVYTMEVLCDNKTTLILKGNITLIR